MVKLRCNKLCFPIEFNHMVVLILIVLIKVIIICVSLVNTTMYLNLIEEHNKMYRVLPLIKMAKSTQDRMEGRFKGWESSPHPTSHTSFTMIWWVNQPPPPPSFFLPMLNLPFVLWIKFSSTPIWSYFLQSITW